MSAEEEQTRLLPVLEGILAAQPNAIISVDTYKAATARAALAAGAEIVNDVSGFTWDAGDGAGVRGIQMRRRVDAYARVTGRMAQPAGAYVNEVLAAVRDGLAASLSSQRWPPESRRSRSCSIPGYGFGKRLNENFRDVGAAG